MYVCMYVCVVVYLGVRTHTYLCMFGWLCIFGFTSIMYVWVYECVCMHERVHECVYGVYVSVYIYIYIYIYVCVCVCIHTLHAYIYI